MKKVLASNSLSIFSLLLGGVFLAAIMPILPNEMRRGFLLSFLIAYPLSLYFLRFGINKYLAKNQSVKEIPKHKVSKNGPKTYQAILDQFNDYRKEIRQQMVWAYGCLIVGLVVSVVNARMETPIYNPEFFSLSVFLFALLAATKDLEKEFELDCNIANCIATGAKMEQDRNLKNQLLTEEARSFEGYGLLGLAFVRISPYLMIAFITLNHGVAHVIAKFDLGVIQYMLFGMILGMLALFFGKRVCAPYRRFRSVEAQNT